jgi:hypothetical protein
VRGAISDGRPYRDSYRTLTGNAQTVDVPSGVPIMCLNGPLNVLRLMQIRRFTRLMNAFRKKWENLKVALALHFAHHNFC